MSDHLRISDAEREAAAAELGEHYAQGRLDAEEHAERLDQIWASRIRGDLTPVFRDLPGRYGPPVAEPAPAARRTTQWAGGVGPFRRGLPAPVVLVMVVLVALTVATHLPLILAGMLVWFLLAGRRRKAPALGHWSSRVR